MTTRLISQTDLPVTVAEARLRLRIDTTGDAVVDAADAADLTMMIAAATELAKGLTRRSIATDTWRLTLDAFPESIQLLYPPVVAVTSITYVAPTGATQTLLPAAFSLDAASEPGWVLPAVGTAWPETMATANAVTVQYTAGFGLACPAPIKQFILLHVGHMHRAREAASDRPMTAIPFADALLDAYRLQEV